MGRAPQKVGKYHFGGRKRKPTKYITRVEATKYLQLSVGDFRRLCILKGIHPKVPTKTQFKNKKNLVKGKALHKGKIYYYFKDIKFMAHDPLVLRFREWKLFMKRLKTAEQKQQTTQIDSLKKYSAPRFTYDHLVKERYPTFQAALNDLDDCLTLMFMFNHLPSGYGGIEPQQLVLVKRLCDEFCTYVAKKRALRKTFLSFKGIYYQAEIWGQKITWIVPFGYTQKIPVEADFKIFKTFLTFYTTLLTFVNYKLYGDEGIAYPPTGDYTPSMKSYIIHSILNNKKSSDSTSAAAPTTKEEVRKHEQRQSEISKLMLKNKTDQMEDSEDNDADIKSAVQLADSEEPKPQTAEELFMHKFKNLFQNMTFFISRECPTAPIEFTVCAFGGKAISDDALLKKTTITHYILDRPAIPANMKSDDCEFIQPQWLFDCVNAKVFIPLEKYRPGQKLPPHLSPFEEDIKEQYKLVEGVSYEPKYAEELRQLVDNEMKALKRVQQRAGGTGEEDDRGIVASVNVGLDGLYSDDEEEEDIRLEDQDSEEENEEERYAREIAMEKTGMKASEFQQQLAAEKKQQQRESMKKGEVKSKQAKKEEEELLLRKSMLSRRQAKLYEKEMRQKEKTKKEALKLQKRRIELEEQEEEDSKNKPQEDVIIQSAIDSDEEIEDNEPVKQAPVQQKKQPKVAEKKKKAPADMDVDDDFDLSQFQSVDDSDDEDDLEPVVVQKKPAAKQQTKKNAAPAKKQQQAESKKRPAPSSNNKKKQESNKKRKIK
jgi:pescadillo protein